MTRFFSALKTELKIFGLLLFSVATSCHIYCQETNEEDELDALLDELFFDEATLLDEFLASFSNQDFIYTALSYNSSTYFSGRRSIVDQFNLVPQVSYYHNSGFTASISGIYYEQFEPNWDFTNVSLGFYKRVGKNRFLYYYAGYSRYFYSSDGGIFTNSIDLNFGINNKKRTLGTRLASSYFFGMDQSFQLVSSSYGSITITKTKKFSIKFRPQLNFIIAQQTIALEKLITDGDMVISEIVDHDIFDLLNTQLSLPITLTTRTFDFQAGYLINFPSPVASEPSLDSTGLFNISIGYLIDLYKKN